MTEVESAGFWIRAAALIIDTVVFVIAALCAAVVMAAAIASIDSDSAADVFGTLHAHKWLMRLVSYLAIVTYHAISECVLGTTFGKRLLGLRVVTLRLGLPSFGQALVRSLGLFADSLFLGVVAASTMRSSPIRQRLGDEWADTRVVKQRSLPEPPWPRKAVFLLVTLSALAAAAEVFVIGLYVLFRWDAR